MSADPQRWRDLPILRELFLQWRDARHGVEGRKRAFSRDWERLLEAAGLTSAELRREADRDARALADAGLVELKAERLRPYQITGIAIPLAAGSKLRIIFAGELPETETSAADLANVAWTPALEFLRSGRTGVPFADLARLNEWLKRSAAARDSIPIKERSLEIFGDEKRLDALMLTTLFQSDRLTLDHLRCHLVPEPLPWKRGRRAAGPVIVLENAATWDSFCRWDSDQAHFAALIYGCGNRFRDGVSFLREIFHEIGGPRPILYFGDLDAPGIRIPRQAGWAARLAGLPAIEADLWSYGRLLERGKPQEYEAGGPLLPEDLDWFGTLKAQVAALLNAKQRLAQEAVGWDCLKSADWSDGSPT